jgi:ubiquinone/menaquinone biosynthesis C-methylase UbiE
MSVQEKSFQSETFLGQSAIHGQWQSDYLNLDMDRFYDLAFSNILDVLQARRGARILDAGCGYCYHTIRLARGGARITAVDFSNVALAAAERNIADAGLRDRVELQRADLTALSFADNTFDFVVSWGVIMHIPDIENALLELARVLKPGGVLVLCENNMHSLDVAVRERLIRLMKRAIGRNVPEIQRTPRGIEAWHQSDSGGLMVRKTDMGFLSAYLRRIGLVEEQRRAGQFTEAYTNVKARWLKRLIYRFNLLYYQHIRSPTLAIGNIVFYRKTQPT